MLLLIRNTGTLETLLLCIPPHQIKSCADFHTGLSWCQTATTISANSACVVDEDPPEHVNVQVIWTKCRFSHEGKCTNVVYIRKSRHDFGLKWRHKRAKCPNFLRCHVSKVHRRLCFCKVLDQTLFQPCQTLLIGKLPDFEAAMLQQSLTLCSPCSAEWMCSSWVSPREPCEEFAFKVMWRT